jgi:nucleoside-diphosphate-sugar epimerase
VSGERRVLLTGASGFIGRQVIPPLLTRGFEVHAACRNGGELAAPDVHVHAADLLAPGQARDLAREVRASHLLHLAWTAVPGRFWTAPDNLDWVAASLELYRGFVAGGGRRAVVAGTCAEYDWRHTRLDELATPCSPDTLYGTAKHALHTILRQAARQDGVSLAWARIFFLYGPHEPRVRLVPDVILSLLEGRPALCGDGCVERDFMHVEDVAGALTATLESGWDGPVNIASGACVALREVIALIAGQIGRPDLVRLGARPTSPGEPPRLAAATSVLREQVRFRPRYMLAEGVAATIDWWRTRLHRQG